MGWFRGHIIAHVPKPAYVYDAVVTRVVDGDSVDLDVDLGFRVWLREVPFRLAGCNAREIGAPGGPEARDHLAGLLPVASTVTVRSIKPDKYRDRWDAQIVLPDGSDLVQQLIADQWAAMWNGLGVKPVPVWPRTVA